MKKAYVKPSLNIEKFVMDIEIMSQITQADIDFMKFQFGLQTDDTSEAAWQNFLATFYPDDDTSGICYHTFGGLS